MFQLENTIVSEDLLENDFVCNLQACKGACCVKGEAGAPLEKSEAEILKTEYPKIKHLLRPEGVLAIEEQGTHVVNGFEDLETPLVNGEECVYVVFDENGITKCGIEEAYNKGLTEFKKPISCHLYPVRVKQYSSFAAVNYHKWDICDAACELGKSLKVPIYKFLKDSLIRKFGKSWYSKLDQVAREQNINK